MQTAECINLISGIVKDSQNGFSVPLSSISMQYEVLPSNADSPNLDAYLRKLLTGQAARRALKGLDRR